MEFSPTTTNVEAIAIHQIKELGTTDRELRKKQGDSAIKSIQESQKLNHTNLRALSMRLTSYL